MRIPNFLRLALALTSVVLLGFAAVARADQGASSIAGLGQTIATAEQRPAGPAAPSPELGQAAGESTPPAATTTNPQTGADAASEPPAETSSPSGASPALTEPHSDVGAANEDPPGASPGASSSMQASQASTAGISEAVREAMLQASVSPHGGSPGGGQDAAAAESSATTQLIWQLQISECAAHCSDIKQYQIAEQHNSTQQMLAGGSSAATEQTLQTAGDRAQATTTTTSIQLGCIAHCFGTTTTTGARITEAFRQVLEVLLAQVARGLPGLSPTPAAEQGTVEQISYQSQSGPAGPLVQVQSASQDSATVQSYDASAALRSELNTLLGSAQAASYEAVNQTEQGIWQLQIGCLVFCEATAQYQQAEQSNTTVQTSLSAPHSQSASASVADTATQLIWQAQIGCLFWCFDATEQQSAIASNTLVVIDADQAAAPISPPSGPGTEPGASAGASQLPGTGAEPAAPAGPPGDSQTQAAAMAGPVLSPRPSSGGDTPWPAPPEHALAGVGLPSTTSTPAAAKLRVGLRRSHMVPARAIASAPLRPPTRAALATLHAELRGGGAARSSRARDGAPFAEVAAGSTLGAGGRAATSTPIGALLAAIALFGLCCLRIAVLRTRQESRAGHADH